MDLRLRLGQEIVQAEKLMGDARVRVAEPNWIQSPQSIDDPDYYLKWDLHNDMPATFNYAKARFYLWATALARVTTGENQY